MVNCLNGNKARPLGVLLLSMLLVNSGFAAEFFTIIGPDGRPIVVPANVGKARNTSSNKSDNISTVTPNPTTPVAKNQRIITPNQQADVLLPVPVDAIAPENLPQSSLTTPQVMTPSTSTNKTPRQTTTQHSVNRSAAIAPSTPPNTRENASKNTVETLESAVPNKASPFTTIDGQQYVNNEYLENKEFNLDDKKRFYVMPEGVIDKNASGVRLQTIEREKGVNRSFLDTVLKNTRKTVQPEPALVLASTYYRVSQAQVEQTIEQRCFSGKPFKKPKKLLSENSLSLFPTAPLKNIFDYELVMLPDTVQDIKLTSFAMSDSQPKFYWPFVVFLDEKGCVLEGAGGFKTEQLPATMLQHSAIQGVIKLPAQTRYLLMTPLSTALDVDETALSNQGQITLTVIR